jgi:hypothetical protein
MTGRDGIEIVMGGEDESYEGLLSPCETYEGSKHYVPCVSDEVPDVGISNKTVVMSPALLAQLRIEARDQPLQEEALPPTLRSMAATPPDR